MMIGEVVGIRCEQHMRINEYTVEGEMWNFWMLKHWPLRGQILLGLCKTLNLSFPNVTFLFRRVRKIAKSGY